MHYMVEYLFVFLQGIFAIFCFIFPGLSLLHFITKGKAFSWPFAFVLTASFLLSSLTIAVYQGISYSFFNVYIADVLTIGLLIFIVVLISKHSGRLMLKYWQSLDKWERLTVKLLIAVFFFCILTMPLSPYPAQEYMGLGDSPAYYRVTKNFIEGKGLLQDYILTEFITEKYSYLGNMPFLIFLTSLFFKIFSVNWYSLFAYNCLSGMLICCLFSSFVLWGREKNIAFKRIETLLALAVLAIPIYFISIGFGVVVLPGTLFFLFLIAITTEPIIIQKKFRYILSACSLLFLFFIRPESRYLAIIFLIIYIPLKLFFISKGNKRYWMGIAVILVAISVWANLPRVFNFFSERFNHASLFFYKYDDQSKNFKSIYDKFYVVHQKITYENIAGTKDFKSIINPIIGREIKDHPIAFIKFIASNYTFTAYLLACTFDSPKLFWPRDLPRKKMQQVLLVTLMILFVLVKREYGLIGLIFIVYLFTIQLLNALIHIRHLLIISIPLLGLFTRRIITGLSEEDRHQCETFFKKNVVASIICLLLMVAIIFNFYTLISFRLDKRNKAYLPIIEAIEKYTTERDVIVSNFPTLFSCMTDRRCIGVLYIVEFLPLIIEYLRPDVIIIDNVRKDGPQNYTLFEKWVEDIEGYKVVCHSPVEEFILFKRK